MYYLAEYIIIMYIVYTTCNLTIYLKYLALQPLETKKYCIFVLLKLENYII